MWNRFQSDAQAAPGAGPLRDVPQKTESTMLDQSFLGSTAFESRESRPGVQEAEVSALHHALSDFVRVFQFRERVRIADHALSVQQCSALETVVTAGPSTLATVSAKLLLDKSTTSRIVDGLERKGYIVRRRDPLDGRAIRITATDEGRAICERVRQNLIFETRRVLESLSPDSRRDAARLLSSLTNAVSARMRTAQA
jgi:MarR family 2-MHQ and catechol resistance regulon transcriptional repressor